jgi:hypothetical protein
MVVFHHDRVIVDNTCISILMTARHICKLSHPKFPYIFLIISVLNTKNKRLDVFTGLRAKNSWPQNVSGLIGLIFFKDQHFCNFCLISAQIFDRRGEGTFILFRMKKIKSLLWVCMYCRVKVALKRKLAMLTF